MFHLNDVVPRESVIGRVLALFDLPSRRRFLCLSAIIALPLIVLSLVTFLEGRFWLGSVTQEVDGLGLVRGMSFFGDTMVWPFCLLVPLITYLLLLSWRGVHYMLNTLCDNASEGWRNEKGKHGMQATSSAVKDIFALRCGWKCKTLKYIPWLIACLFWSYNTLTCGFNVYLPNAMYPYKSSDVVVLTPADQIDSTLVESDVQWSGGEEISPQRVMLSRKVALPKWDCQPDKAFWSCLLTRVWTLFFYGITPFVLVRFIVLIWGVSFFLKQAVAWDASLDSVNAESVFPIKPFTNDDYCGLSYISDCAMTFFYGFCSLMLLMLMAFLKEGVDPSWHNYLMLFFVIPVAVFAFFVPIYYVRVAIVHAKDFYLEKVNAKLNAIYSRTTESIENCVSRDYLSTHSHLSSLLVFHKEIGKMPVWPFSASVIMRMAVSSATPFLLLYIQHLFQHYFLQ